MGIKYIRKKLNQYLAISVKTTLVPYTDSGPKHTFFNAPKQWNSFSQYKTVFIERFRFKCSYYVVV